MLVKWEMKIEDIEYYLKYVYTFYTLVHYLKHK